MMSFSQIMALCVIALLANLVSSRSVPAPCRFPIAPENTRFCCINAGPGCIQEGQACTTTNVNNPAVPCRTGLTCVVSNFGKPDAAQDSNGRCQKLEQTPKKCMIERCSRTGQKTVCRISGVTATCGAWATRTDSGPKPDCPKICTFLLQIPQPKGSDGELYGNEGCLVVASCESNFKIYGPVPSGPRDICKKPIGPLLQNRCCIDYGIECAKVGETCTSSPGEKSFGQRECKKGLTCVIADTGSDELGLPEGKCKKLEGKLRNYTARRCSNNGPEYICKIPKSKIVTTCKVW